MAVGMDPIRCHVLAPSVVATTVAQVVLPHGTAPSTHPCFGVSHVIEFALKLFGTVCEAGLADAAEVNMREAASIAAAPFGPDRCMGTLLGVSAVLRTRSSPAPVP